MTSSSSSSTEEDLLVVAQMNQFGMQAMEQCRTTDASWILRHTIGYWMMQPTRRKESSRQDANFQGEFFPQPYHHHSISNEQTEHAYWRRSQTIAPCPRFSTSATIVLQMRPMTYELREAVQRHAHIYEKLPISLYTKAFFIYPCAMPRNVVTALLWYNHGLCCHMHGLTQGNASGALQEALQFYHHAYQIVLAECAISFSESGLLRKSDDRNTMDSLVVQQYLCMVAAAVCHNMALLYHYTFGHMAAARSLRCQLLHWIQTTTSDGDGVFFHLGIFLARMDDFRLAPAA
jgi:hypothetical protein